MLIKQVFLIIFYVNLTRAIKEGHLKKFGSQGPFVKIHESTELSSRLFFDNYVKTKTPLLMRNEAKKFSAYKKWSDSYLNKKVQDYDENYQVSVETVKKESRDQQVERIEFVKFLDVYKQSNYYLVTSLPEFLKSDIQLPNVLQCGQAPKTLQKTVNF